MPDFEWLRKVTDRSWSGGLDQIQKFSFSVEVVWNTTDLLTSAGWNTAVKQRKSNTMNHQNTQSGIQSREWRTFALRNIASALAIETDPQKFENLSKWLVIYLDQVGVSR